MKLAIKIVLFLFINIISAQSNNYNGTISYTVSFSQKIIQKYFTSQRKKIKNKQTIKLYDDGYLKSKDIEAILKFNHNESSFVYVNPLEKERESQKDFLSILINVKNRFYANYFKKESLQSNCELLGECFLISSIFQDWTLTQKTKTIGKYTCYKAININNKGGGNKRKITAWYTPEIPVSFGPFGYNGLPGLILELDDETFFFSVKKINLTNKKKINIKKLIKGKKVSEEMFNKMVKEAFLKL